MKRHLMLKALLPVVFMLNFSVPAHASIDPDLDSTLQHCIDSLRIYYQLKGITAAAYIPGQGMWQGVTGVSYGAVPIDSSMILNMGSITKTFISAEIFKLIEAGQLSLNDTIGALLPPFNFVNPGITIRQLLSHRSGLAEYLNSGWQNSVNSDPYRIWNATDALDTFLTAPDGIPGAPFAYRNTNYALLGLLIESMKGDSLHNILRNDFITPLNLDDTYMEVFEQYPNTVPHNWSTPTLDPNQAWDAWNVPRIAASSSTEAAGGLFTSAADLAWWGYNLYSGNVISDSSISEITTFNTVAGGYFNGYGLGCMRFPYQGKTYWGHAGNFFGFAACMLYYPQYGVSVAVLINIDSYGSNVAKPLINFIVNDLTTGIHAPEGAMTFTLCPNPASGQLAVRSSRFAIRSIEIYSPFGEKVLDVQATSAGIQCQTYIDVSRLSPSVYFVKVETEKGSAVQKLIIQ
jgi:D-alanyl-D-alanine carboxypeptidase